MPDQAKASQLAQEGLALWEKSELELAIQKTKEKCKYLNLLLFVNS